MSTLSTTNLKHPSSGSNNIVLNTDGTTTIAAPSNIIKSGTAVASTSGTSIDFTGIPSWVKRVTVMFSGVSTNGASLVQVQIGSGSFTTSGYSGFYAFIGSSSVSGGSTSTGFAVQANSAGNTLSGVIKVANITGNAWVGEVNVGSPGSACTNVGGGSVTLSGTLDRVRITTVNGTDTFDAGTINILWEG